MQKLLLPLFLLLCLAQLYIPAQMISAREKVLQFGSTYKFQATPYDPNDPFRGKYLRVSFSPTFFEMKDSVNWQWQEQIYVQAATDNQGFFRIKNLSRTEPQEGDYFSATVNYTSWDSKTGLSKVRIDYPFNRFYIEESKAAAAETLYREVLKDPNRTAYALVSIMDGEAVFKDLMIDGVSYQRLGQ